MHSAPAQPEHALTDAQPDARLQQTVRLRGVCARHWAVPKGCPQKDDGLGWYSADVGLGEADEP